MKKLYILSVALVMINNATAQWILQSSVTLENLNSVYFTDANTGYAAGDSGAILKTTDGGVTWSIKNSNTLKDLHSVYFVDLNTGYAVGAEGIIIKSIDGGESWNLQVSGIEQNLNSVFFTDMNIGYAAGSCGDSMYIIKTSNGGDNWSISYLVVDSNQVNANIYILSSVHFPDNDVGYAVGGYFYDTGEGPILLKSTNGGTNWSAIDSLVHGIFHSVFFINRDTGYIAGKRHTIYGNSGVIYKTTDGGATWISQISTTVPPFILPLQAITFLNSDTGYAVGWGGTILKTYNGGADWITQNSGTATTLNTIHFPSADTGYVAGFNGTILKTTNGGGFPVEIDEIADCGIRITNYPNPVRQTTTYSYALKESIHVTIQIFDNFGQLVAEPMNDNQTKGEHQLIWNAGNLPTGIYFYCIYAGNEAGRGKMVVMK